MEKMKVSLGVKWELLRKRHPELRLPSYDDLMNRIPNDEIEAFQKQLERQLGEPDKMVKAHNDGNEFLKAMFNGKEFRANWVKTKIISNKKWRKLNLDSLPLAESGDGACLRCVFCRGFSNYWVKAGFVSSSTNPSIKTPNLESRYVICCDFDESFLPKKFSLQSLEVNSNVRPRCDSFTEKKCESEDCDVPIKWNKKFCPKHQASHQRKILEDIVLILVAAVLGALLSKLI